MTAQASRHVWRATRRLRPGHEQPHHSDQTVRGFLLSPGQLFNALRLSSSLSLPPKLLLSTRLVIMADTLNYSSSPRPNTPSNNQNNPLTAIIRRLEAATSRLEDIASSSTSFESLENGKIAQANAPRASAPNLPGTVVGHSPATEEPEPTAPELPPAIKEMDELIENDVKNFVEASRGIDPLVESQVGVCEPWKALRITR